MSGMTHERTAVIRRRQVERIVRSADRAGRKVARRNARLAAAVAPNLLPEQAVAVIAAAVANSAAEAVAPTPTVAVAPTRRRSRRGAIRAAIVAGVLIVATASTLSTADMRQTHAWFTAKQVTNGNTVTAAVVKIAGVGPAVDPGSKLSVPNLLPLSDADAADPTRGVFLDLTVRNTGTVPINWTLALTGVTTTAGTVDLGAITNVSYSVAGGAWSPAQRLNAPLSVSGQNLAPGTTGNTTPIRLRFWLDKTAGNEAQGAVASFTTDLQAIQTGAS